MRSRIFYILVFLGSFSFSFLSVPFSHWASVVPRDELRVEMMLSANSNDTSSTPKVVTATGNAPAFLVDGIYGVPYAKFSGTWGLRVTTGWNGTSTDNFTVSFWVKVKKSELPTMTGATYPAASVPPIGWVSGVSTQYLSTVFSTQLSQDINTLGFRIRSDYKCGVGWKSHRPFYYYLDAINNPTTLIDCSRLSDEKWHVVILRRYNKVLNIRIDDQEVYNAINDMTIWKTIWIGQHLLLADTGALAYGLGQDPRMTNNFSYFRSGLFGFRLYSRYLTDAEILALSEEFQWAQSDIVWVGNTVIGLEWYTRPFLKFTLKNIPLSLDKWSVEYQYSSSGNIFLPIDVLSISNISTDTGSLAYRFSLDMTGISDGNITVTLRVKTGTSFQNIGTIKFIKSDTTFSITVNQPDTLLSSSKILSAIRSTGWVLSMSLTRWNICDWTLVFEEYSELLFTSKIDNAQRVCYKSYFAGVGRTIYKLSDPIQGINSVSNTSLTAKIFDDYTYWTKSNYPRFNDTATLVLDLLWVSAASTNGTINGVTLTDINGDGLVDFLYSRNDPVRRSIIINNGNYTFKIAYKCAIDGTMYYGDCADLTR